MPITKRKEYLGLEYLLKYKVPTSPKQKHGLWPMRKLSEYGALTA